MSTESAVFVPGMRCFNALGIYCGNAYGISSNYVMNSSTSAALHIPSSQETGKSQNVTAIYTNSNVGLFRIEIISSRQVSDKYLGLPSDVRVFLTYSDISWDFLGCPL